MRNQTGHIERRRERHASKRHAEPVQLGKREVGEQHDQSKRYQQWRLPEYCGLREHEVGIDDAEQDQAQAMACVEANRRAPDGGFLRNHRAGVFHRQHDVVVTGMQFVAIKREQ